MMQFLTALLLGLVYVAPPGPVNVETIRRGATAGFRGAFGLQLGALVGDLVYAGLALLGVGALLPTTVLHLGPAPLSALVLVYLGYTAPRDDISGLRRAETHRIARSEDGAGSLRHGALAGLGIALTNPFAVAFWLTVGSAMLPHDRDSDVWFLAAFFLGSGAALGPPRPPARAGHPRHLARPRRGSGGLRGRCGQYGSVPSRRYRCVTRARIRLQDLRRFQDARRWRRS